MPANLRDWYLDALGIVQYRSRDEGAVDIPFHMESQTQPESQPQPQSKIVDVREVLETAPEAKVVKPASTEAIEKAGTPVVEPEAIQSIDPLRVACWQSGEDLLVINAFPPGNVPLPEELDLLYNLLRAIGRLDNDKPTADYIDWPLTPGEPADLQGAKSMLSVFLDSRIRKCGVLWVILMGELPASLFLPSQSAGDQGVYDQATFENVLGEIEDLPGGARAMVIPSLQTMLRCVSSKQIAWTTLQKLLVPRE